MLLYRPAIEPLVPAPSFARRCLKAAGFSTMAHSGRRQCPSSSNDVSLPFKSYADLPQAAGADISAPRFAERDLWNSSLEAEGSIPP